MTRLSNARTPGPELTCKTPFRLATAITLWCGSFAVGIAHAQTGRPESQSELEVSQTDEAKSLPSKWIVGASGGMIARTANDAEPFVAGGISRKLGRGYIRLSATTYRSTFRQVDAVLPSRFTIGALSGGATFGLWFVDGYASYGRQSYGGVTTALGTRPSQVGTGSPVQGAGASGGRYISLGGNGGSPRAAACNSRKAVRLSRRLWLDVGVTQTIGVRAGDVAVATLCARFGF